MSDRQIPGFAIAVVKDDKIAYAKGYGVREIGKSEAVNETKAQNGHNQKSSVHRFFQF